MKNLRYMLIAGFPLATVLGSTYVQGARDVLFQTSFYNALDKGVAEGEITFRDLKQHGDFGIGTFNAVDGEMVGFDGNFYQVKVDGVAYPVDDSMQTPFSFVTSFKPDKSASLGEAADYKQLKGQLDKLLPTKNIFHAIKIQGTFKYIKAGGVPRQKRPYSPLAEVFKRQRIFEFRDVQCTRVGFYCPSYVAGLNIPGYHFHFLTEDKKAGGHLFECHMEKGLVEIDHISALYLALPETDDFFKVEALQ